MGRAFGHKVGSRHGQRLVQLSQGRLLAQLLNPRDRQGCLRLRDAPQHGDAARRRPVYGDAARTLFRAAIDTLE